MRVSHFVCAGLVVGALLVLGCNDKGGMQNMVPGTGHGQQLELKLKKGNKPMPVDPPSPKAPPR
jgi:hypothetical protein